MFSKKFTGGAIGACLPIGSGGALYKGGPAALIIGYLIVSVVLLFTIQTCVELAVIYPINGAFYTYVVRFVDPSWGFTMGRGHALAWLTVKRFELIAASITIDYWRSDSSVAVWVTVFLAILCIIQIFGVRVPAKAISEPPTGGDPGAFKNGFNGLADVFFVAAFPFGDTELVGLAAAEPQNPRKAIPLATKQVFFRITLLYIANLFVLGLFLPLTDTRLAEASGANSKASPFVLAIKDTGVRTLASIFNAVITIPVISVATSCTFGSTRTMQATTQRGMAPKILAYVDKAGRPTVPTPDATPDAEVFFQSYMAASIVIVLYLVWKVYTRDWRPWVKLSEMDLMSGARLLGEEIEPTSEKTCTNLPIRMVRGLF
ncbi:hypothetical protein DL770_002874 [Monosporascus sp. CRB-9-2]|nr:hypothetical protein DL770_002874 [Monosporascus sp. CRB-9-2]